MNTLKSALAICVAVMAAGSSSFGQQTEYAFLILPKADSGFAASQAISNSGVVVGMSSYEDQGRATLWDGDSVQILGTFGDTSTALSIGPQGWIVGWSGQPAGDNIHRRATLWHDGNLIDLGTLGGNHAEALSVNGQGQIVGRSTVQTAVRPTAAFLWQNDVMTALPPLDPDQSAWALDINEHGQIVGTAWSVEDEPSRPVTWIDGEILVLDFANWNRNSGGRANAINDLGHIVGSYNGEGGGDYTAGYIWRDGYHTGIPSPFIRGHTHAVAVNNLDEVVGYVYEGPNGPFAFFWTEERRSRLLSHMMPQDLPWNIEIATGINDAGQITGIASPADGVGPTSAFLMTPVSPTMSLSIPIPARAGETNWVNVTGCPPGSKVHLLYGSAFGGYAINDCDLQDNALQLHDPRFVAARYADQDGSALIPFDVREAARNAGQVWMQAVVAADCAISNVVPVEFE